MNGYKTCASGLVQRELQQVQSQPGKSEATQQVDTRHCTNLVLWTGWPFTICAQGQTWEDLAQPGRARWK
eukprot:2558251-Alexandrium_andersonii.AAC.1